MTPADGPAARARIQPSDRVDQCAGRGRAFGGHLCRPDTLIPLLIGLSLLYVAGMYLNDAFDAEIDARERAEQADSARGGVTQRGVRSRLRHADRRCALPGHPRPGGRR